MASRTPLVENFEDIVEITHVEDGPFAFWITLESESYDFHQFLARLNSEPTVPYQGKFYKNQLLKVEYNKMLWRALLINYNDSQDMYTVILPDKGLCIEVNSDSFYDIHNDYSTIGYFAHLVTLHMAEETLNAKDPRIYDWFCQLSNSQRSTFQMRIVTPPSTNHKASCELYLKETRPYRDTNSSASGLQSMLAALQARQHMRYSDLPLDLSKELEVQVSAVTSKSPWSFGARLASNEAELGILQADLQEFCKDQALPLSVIPKPEEPIFTFYKGNWFRAKTRQVSMPHKSTLCVTSLLCLLQCKNNM
ncbi:hypothetical protein B566_EDAN008565 [Ephemera danica]|nr:hypothetical protein B566_EDAN008565 [Ephemera danica]